MAREIDEYSKGRYTRLDSNILKYPLESGGEILIEIEPPKGVAPIGSQKVPLIASDTLDYTLNKILKATNLIIRPNDDQLDVCDEIQIEFGIKFNANGDGIITSGEDKANFKISLKKIRK